MKILLLSPHGDDVELGCGGSIARFLEEGHKILWLVFSTADESLPAGLPPDTLKEEFISVTKSLGLGAENYKIFNFTVRELDKHRQELLEELIKARDEFQPDIVIGPSLKDFHQDHGVIANDMVRAFKTNASIICYELPWNQISFDTQLFIKLKKSHVKQKSEMLRKYQSQLTKQRQYFSEDYTYGLARVRGVQCNAEYAEAFEVIRWMIS